MKRMNEKPRLKDTDEILSSIARQNTPEGEPRQRRQRRPARLAPTVETAPPVIPPEIEEPEARDIPLNFTKYELPKIPAPESRNASAKPSTTADAARNFGFEDARGKSQGEQPEQHTPTQKQMQEYAFPTLEELDAAPEVKAYSFEDFGGDPKSEPTTQPEPKPQPAPTPEVPQRPMPELEPLPTPERAPSPHELPEQKPMPERPPTPHELPDLEPLPELEPLREPENPLASLLQDEEYRESFVRGLSSSFEEQFAQKFGGRNADEPPAAPPAPVAEAPAVRERTPRRATQEQQPEQSPRQPVADVLRAPEPKSTAPIIQKEPEFQVPTATESPYSDAPVPAHSQAKTPTEPEDGEDTESFLSHFARNVQQEESDKTEQNKESLAQKFMREREQYLRELGLDELVEEEKQPEPPAPRRRLDFAIQPEMHVQADSKATAAKPLREPHAPVTYNRSAILQPQVKQPEPDAPEPASANSGKKTSEQLLLELGRELQKKTRVEADRKTREENAGFTFSAPPPSPWEIHVPQDADEMDEQPVKLKKVKPVREKPVREKPERKPTPANLWLASSMALLSLAVLAVAVNLWLNRDPFVVPENQEVAAASGAVTFYEDRSFTQRGRLGDVIIPRKITVRNLDVDNRLVVEAIESPGTVRLDDVSVGGMIYVKNSQLTELVLNDVQAARVVIDNADARVTVRVMGKTDIAALELRSASVVEQMDLAQGYDGVDAVITKSPDSGGAIDAKLVGLVLGSLVTEGDCVLELDGGSVDMLSAAGSLSLSGQGKVLNLSAQDSGDGSPLSLQIKGVDIVAMNLKSPATIMAVANIDAISTSDDLSVTGSGRVGSVTMNERFGSARLAATIDGVNVSSVMINAESRLSVTGSGHVDAVAANSSLYLLGKKVNLLSANADGVYYEIEPDRVALAQGILPPQTTADNPHIDFMGTRGATDANALLNGMESTCGHSADSGGFKLGNGSKDDPFQVETPAQLAHVGLHIDSHFRQTGDIDIADDSTFAAGFSMIASAGRPFSGMYDGGGHYVKNLRITTDAEYVGLFAENIGSITNLSIASGDIVSTNTGKSFVGAVAGMNYQSGLILSCANAAKVSAKELSYAGGLAGYNFGGRIKDCYNTAKISGAGQSGGIAGVNMQGSSITGCYSIGAITADIAAGAITGTNEDSVITNCYYLEDSAESGVGTGDATATMLSTEELAASRMAVELAAGNESSRWKMPPDSSAYRYPVVE